MIFVTGDTHGPKRVGFSRCDGFMHRLNTDSFPEQKKLCKDDIVIILGDFGGVWEEKESKEEKNALNWLSSRSFTTVFIDGNHENHDRLATYPVINWHGGKVHMIRDSVFHLMRGEIFAFEDKSFFTFGGARSHDIKDGILDPADFSGKRVMNKRMREMIEDGKLFRIKGINWWEGELPNEEEMAYGRENLRKNGNQIDFILTHECPFHYQEEVSIHPSEDSLSAYLSEIERIQAMVTGSLAIII